MQSWYRVACAFLWTVRDVETLSETTFPIQRLHGDQNAFYPIHMSLLYDRMLGNDVSFYKYVWQTADWDISYSIFIGIDGYLFYITLIPYKLFKYLMNYYDTIYLNFIKCNTDIWMTTTITIIHS